MKYCEKCHKTFDNGNYCPQCGSPLSEYITYDIFGDPMNDRKDYTQAKPNPTYTNFTYAKNEPNRVSPEKLGEIMFFSALISCLYPLIGGIIAITSVILNSMVYATKKKNLVYFILAVLVLAINIAWTIILIKYGIFSFSNLI